MTDKEDTQEDTELGGSFVIPDTTLVATIPHHITVYTSTDAYEYSTHSFDDMTRKRRQACKSIYDDRA